jgi:hypothetical protein
MRLFTAVCFAAALSACTASSSPTTPTPPTASTSAAATVRVSGRIIDYSTAQSVPGVAIIWRPGNSHLVLSSLARNGVSDAAGRFSIDIPVTEDFSAVADPLLFETAEGSGTIRIPGKSLDTAVFVNPGGCNVRYGYVYDAVTRQAIAGARVARRNSALTDASGYYQFEVVCNAAPEQSFGIGTTTIGASHPAYQSAWEIDGRSEWTGRPAIRRVDFALQPLAQ